MYTILIHIRNTNNEEKAEELKCLGSFTLEEANEAITYLDPKLFPQIIELNTDEIKKEKQYTMYAREVYINALKPNEIYRFPESEAEFYPDQESSLVTVEEIGIPIVVERTDEDEAQFLIKFYFLVDEKNYELKALRLFADLKETIWEKLRKSYLKSGLFNEGKELDFMDIGISYVEPIPFLYFYEKKSPEVRKRITQSAWTFSFVWLKLDKYKKSPILQEKYPSLFEYIISDLVQ